MPQTLHQSLIKNQIIWVSVQHVNDSVAANFSKPKISSFNHAFCKLLKMNAFLNQAFAGFYNLCLGRRGSQVQILSPDRFFDELRGLGTRPFWFARRSSSLCLLWGVGHDMGQRRFVDS
jgi:hypothetical protein